MPLAKAETLIAYARFLRHTGRCKQAREMLHRALEVLEPTDAGRLQSIASEELAATGGRRRRSHPTTALTAQEQRVAALAARGLTSLDIARCLFISAKTVDHHLAHVYAKLGIHSRHELILAWHDQATSPPPAAQTPRSVKVAQQDNHAGAPSH
jgi:DNA-binding CsgD family transcriptional regulator